MPEAYLYARCASDMAVLYWDKPSLAAADAVYTVFINDKKLADTKKTHCTIQNLVPDTDYTVQVQMGGHWVGGGVVHTGREKHRIDVTTAPYWAKGDGNVMNTAALQRAIDACGPEDILYFPAGDFLTGALRLHSDMEIYLAKGANIIGNANPRNYEPRIPSRFEGVEMLCYSSLLNAGTLDHTQGANCRNITIRGEGSIVSGGQELAMNIIRHERERLQATMPDYAEKSAACENDDTLGGRVRPRLINLSNCENVWIHGITLKNGASWNLHMIYCKNIVTDHCTFISEGVWNGDGWDPDSSEDCTLFAGQFFTGDDAVAIKSGKNPEGNQIGRPCRGIKVFDCRSAFGHGICIGSEMSGGVEDVQIWDCDLENALSGIEIKTTPKRGGYVRGVTVRDCISPRVMVHSVPYNDDGTPAPDAPVLTHMTFERLTLTGRALGPDHNWQDVAPIELAGFAQPGHEIKDVLFRDITITAQEPALPLKLCSDVSFTNLCCKPAAK